MKLKDLKCISQDIDLNWYLDCQNVVKEKMNHPEWLGDLTRDDLKYLLEHGSKIWVYTSNKKFVCSMMLLPSSVESIQEMGLDLDYRMVSDYGPMFVHPDFRGHSLQYQMLQELDDYCLELGYHYAVGTIHPDNYYSIHNLEKDGFQYLFRKDFSRGVRNIYLKKYPR